MAPSNGFTSQYETCGTVGAPPRDFEPVGQVLIETGKYTEEIAAMARELADLLGGPAPATPQVRGDCPMPNDVRTAVIEHRARLSWIGEELRRALRSLKG